MTAVDPFHEVEKQPIVKVDALALEADHFVQALQGRKKLAITAKEATRALTEIEEFIQKLDHQSGVKP